MTSQATDHVRGPLPGAAAPAPLALARYRFTAAFERELVLPAYAGSLLRSVLGLALRRGACVTGASACKGCPLLQGCAYAAIFETPPRATQLPQQFSDVPHPYVIEPPPLGAARVGVGQPLVWHMVLAGADTLGRLPLLVQAWQRALRDGLGPQRVRGRLIAMQLVDAQGHAQPAYDLAQGRLLPHASAVSWPAPPASAAGDVLQLHFHSPCACSAKAGRCARPS